MFVVRIDDALERWRCKGGTGGTLAKWSSLDVLILAARTDDRRLSLRFNSPCNSRIASPIELVPVESLSAVASSRAMFPIGAPERMDGSGKGVVGLRERGLEAETGTAIGFGCAILVLGRMLLTQRGGDSDSTEGTLLFVGVALPLSGADSASVSRPWLCGLTLAPGRWSEVAEMNSSPVPRRPRRFLVFSCSRIAVCKVNPEGPWRSAGFCIAVPDVGDEVADSVAVVGGVMAGICPSVLGLLLLLLSLALATFPEHAGSAAAIVLGGYFGPQATLPLAEDCC